MNTIKEYEECIANGMSPKEAQTEIREWMRGDNLGKPNPREKEYMRLRIRAWEAEQAFQSFKQECEETL